MSDHDRARSQKSRLSSPLLWVGFAVIRLGVAVNLVCSSCRSTSSFDNPRLVPTPEAPLGQWVVAVGTLMLVWSQRRGAAGE